MITYHTQTVDIHNKKNTHTWSLTGSSNIYYIFMHFMKSVSLNYPGKSYTVELPSHYHCRWNSWHLHWYFHIQPVDKYFEDSKPIRGRFNCLSLLPSLEPIANLPTGLWLLHLEIIWNRMWVSKNVNSFRQRSQMVIWIGRAEMARYLKPPESCNVKIALWFIANLPLISLYNQLIIQSTANLYVMGPWTVKMHTWLPIGGQLILCK